MSDETPRGADIIDITDRLPVGGKVTMKPEPSPFDCAPDGKRPCQHRRYVIDRKQRTVKCSDCNEWLDPVWVLDQLWEYYDKRVDRRLDELKELEARYAERQKREGERRSKRPSRAKRKATRDEHLTRAAWQEYQSKLALIRAEKLRGYAAKIDDELADEPEATA